MDVMLEAVPYLLNLPLVRGLEALLSSVVGSFPRNHAKRWLFPRFKHIQPIDVVHDLQPTTFLAKQK